MNETKKDNFPTDKEISVYAYHLWESDGRPQGRDMDFWLQAKAHLIADRQVAAEKRSQNIPTQKPQMPSLEDGLSADKPSRRKKADVRPAPGKQAAYA